MTSDQMGAVADVVCEVIEERKRQFAKFGDQSHLPDGTGGGIARGMSERMRADCEQAFRLERGTYADILLEEVWEALAESDAARLRAELIQVAAVAVQWVEALDRRGAR